jgi:hypothetical protein
MKYTNAKRKLSLILSVFLCTGTVFSTYAQEITKYETVFVNLQSDGQKKDTIVSNWLKDSRLNKQIIDKANIKDIENVSSGISPIIKNDGMIWRSDGEDVVYQGKSTKNIPVTTKITYYLDEKEISAKELAGKSGKVKINIKFENNTATKKIINNKMETIYTPFTVATVIGFSNEKFSNIQSENSKIFSDGNNQMVMFMGFPGLENSLKLKETTIDKLKDIDIKDEFTVTADVKDFELSTIAIVMTPQLPDMLKDIDTDKKKINENKKDIDDAKEDIKELKEDLKVARTAKQTLEKKDANKSLKSMIIDDKKIKDSRTLIDDLFEYYELDKELVDILPKYVTDENISLYDRIKRDFKDVDIQYLLDNKVLRGITDRLDDKNINKSRVLIKDYDELKTFDTTILDKGLDVLDSYDSIKPMIDTSAKLYDNLQKHDKQIDVLDKASKYTDRVFDIMDKVQDMNIGGSTLSDSDIQVMVEALANKKRQELSHTFTSLLPENPTDKLSVEQQKKLVTLIDRGVNSGQIGVTTGTQLRLLVDSGYIPTPYRTKILEAFSSGVQREVYNKIGNMKSDVQEVLYDLRTLQIDIENDMGYNYRSDLRESFEYIDDIMPDLRYIRDIEKNNRVTVQKAIDLATNEKDVQYLKYWGHKAKDMKEDMDNNDENINVMRDLLNQYDDPKIKYIYSQIPKLRADMDEARPIIENLSDELDIEKYNISLHKSPKTVKTLLNMKKDLDNTRYIADNLKLALDDEVVKAARSIIEIIDRRDSEGGLDEIDKTVDNIDEKISEAGDKLEDIKDLLDRKDAIIDLSKSYDTFSGKQENMDSKVTFVMKTDEIKVEEKKKVYEEEKEEKKSFIKWIKNIFNRKKA